MKAKIKRSAFTKILNQAQSISEKRNTIPILANVLIEVLDDEIQLMSTNLEVSVISRISAEVKEKGKVVVNARSLFGIVKEFSEGEIILEKFGSEGLRLKQKKSVFELSGLSVEEYPVFPKYNLKGFTKINSHCLSDMIEKTIYSISNDETRYHLNGIYFEREKEGKDTYYRMVATDGHRLSVVNRKVQEEGKFEFPEKGVIIPGKGASEIKKMLETGNCESVEISLEGSQLILKKEEEDFFSVLMIRLIEGKYPNYKKLIPNGAKETLNVEREAFSSTLKRVSLLSNHQSRGIVMNLKEGTLKLTSNNEMGQAREEIDVNYKGKEIKIGFNAKYILDILNSFHEDKVMIEIKDNMSPGLVYPAKDNGYKCVIMPMRI